LTKYGNIWRHMIRCEAVPTQGELRHLVF